MYFKVCLGEGRGVAKNKAVFLYLNNNLMLKMTYIYEVYM